MAKAILVFGLPGSGKTTLANKLFQKLSNAEHINADMVRQKFNDWDFSEIGRIRQGNRMVELAKNSTAQWAIVDFVCPKESTRVNGSFDLKIFMDTISQSRYQDTNKVFERPETPLDYHFKEFNSDEQVNLIVNDLQTFDWKKPTVQLLGRWQPWHAGHLKLFQRALSKTGQVTVQVRDTSGTDTKNPFVFEEVKTNIIKNLHENGYILGKEYIIQQVPNITNITYGRDVGYAIEKEKLDKETEEISATKIRARLGK